MTTDTAAPPSVELDPLDPHVHERRWLILGVLCLSLLIIVMDNTILNVAIPSLINDLDATNSQVQWIVDSYVLVFAGLLLTTGSLSDRFGRKGALQVGIVLFGIGSIASALADTATQLIYTRAFMGIGGALIMPATLSILTNVFRDPRERGRAIAIWAGLLRHRRRHRPDDRRLPAEALLVALGVLGEHPDRRASRSSLGGFVDPRPRATRARAGSTRSVRSCRSSASASLLFGIIEGPAKGWTARVGRRRVRRRRRRDRVVRALGAAHRQPDARHDACSATPGSPPRAAPSRWCSSPCSARCS